MAINIDDVYQKVLTLSSKEQRGYITPQEFNILVNKAQFEIFEDYFHDFKTTELKPQSDRIESDDRELLEHKLHPFRMFKTVTIPILPGSPQTVSYQDMAVGGHEVHYIEGVRLKEIGNPPAGWDDSFNPEIVPMSTKEFLDAQAHPFTKATNIRPVFERIGQDAIKIWPGPDVDQYWGVTFNTYRKPIQAKWGYVVVRGRALYNNNPTFSTDLELHASEEELVVAKVLQFAGVAINKQELIGVGGGMEQQIKQQKND